VTLSIAKRPGANAISVADEVLRKVDLLKGSRHSRRCHRQHHAQLRRDGGGEIERTAAAHGHRRVQRGDPHLAHARLAGVGIVAVAIPATLALTLLVFYLYGFTLNRITLFALIFSIGILVDDAIVVVENIVRHFHLPQNKGRNWSAIAVEAVGEVGNPTILATFAVIAAVLPMAFVGGLMGPYMRPDSDWCQRGDVLVAAHRVHRHAVGFDSHSALGEEVFEGTDRRHARPEDLEHHDASEHPEDFFTKLYRRMMGR
jgi:hypothetical protein